MPLTIALKLSERLIEHADFNEPQVHVDSGWNRSSPAPQHGCDWRACVNAQHGTQ